MDNNKLKEFSKYINKTQIFFREKQKFYEDLIKKYYKLIKDIENRELKN